MTDPITPPPELVQQWCSQLFGCDDKPELAAYELARLASEWGATQERERLVNVISSLTMTRKDFRNLPEVVRHA